MTNEMLPAEWITGYTGDGTDISIPYASLPEITADTEADTATGSIASVLHALLDAVAAHYSAMEAKPVNMGVFKSVSYNQSTGKFSLSYTVSFTASAAAGSLNPDPEATNPDPEA